MKNDDSGKRNEKGARKMGAYAKKYVKIHDEPGNMNDLGALLDVAVEQIGSRQIGRIATYENSEAGLNDFLEATKRYFEYIRDANVENEEKLIPDIEGWCIFIGVTRQTVLNYAKRDSKWDEAITYIKDAILAAKKQLAFRFKIPPVVFLNDISNNHGYLNTNEFHLIAMDERNRLLRPRESPQEIVARRMQEEPERPKLE